jgi:protease-4
MKRGLLLFLLSPLLLQSSASAAPVGPSPFRGALIPAAAVAGDADATSVEVNPGQLGLLDGASAALVFDHWSDDLPLAGRGTALLAGTPLFLGLTLGAGFQWLRPTLPAPTNDDFSKLQLGLGWRLGRALGLGVGWEHLFGGPSGGRGSVTLGMGLRLHPALALGAVVRDVGRPRPAEGADRLPRRWEGELALRPLGTSRLEVALGLRYDEGADDRPLRPRGRLSLRIRRGLVLFGEVDAARDERVSALDPAAAPSRVDWSLRAGLDVAMDRVGLTAAAVSSASGVGEGDTATPGGSFVLHSAPTRRAPVVAVGHIERVKLSGLGGDGGFLQMVVTLRRLADDPTVVAVLLEIEGLDLGAGRVDELRALVEALRRRKPVVASLTSAGTREYYLASGCDRVVIHPAGSLSLGGLAQTVTFYKGTLDRLGVQVQLVRIAEYKGAMEPFVMTANSEPVRQNRNAMLDDQYSRLLEGIARGRAGRGLAAEALPSVFAHALYGAADAKQQGLVDAVADDREVEQVLAAVLGRRWPVRSGSARIDPVLWRPARVGVVLIDGAIADGGPDQGPRLPGGEVAFADPIIAAVDEMRRDGSVRAVVLRVNSPGGSAFASDRIARAVIRLRAAGKPVIVSMGDLAASGGYYVAAPCDEILASAGTITGSIGIFGYKVDLQGLLGKVGVGAELYRRGPHADLFSPYRAWTDEEQGIVRDHIGRMYQLFLDTVAAGRHSRGITAARANELGRGRVYTGAQALDVRLVDRLGGLSDALDEAARRGRVPRGPGGIPELVVLPRPLASPIDTLLRLAGVSEEASASDAVGALLTRQARGAARLLAPLLLGQGSGFEARLPYDVE